MLSKLAAVAVVLGALPVAILLAGGLPDGPRQDLVPYETRTVGAEEEWRNRVEAICDWEKQQAKALTRAFRRIQAPVDVEFLFKSAIRLSDESRAIFARLAPPLEYRRERSDLLRLFRQERSGLADALEAFKERRRRAFIRSVRRFVEADTRSSRLLAQLGVDGCNVKPVTVPQSSRVRTV